MATETRRLRELTVRYTVKRDDEGRPIRVGRMLTTPRESVSVLMPLLQHEPSEVFAVLFLSTRHHVLAYHEVGRGTLDTVLVTPRLCWAEHKRGYVAEIVMWPWPWRAADHRARQVIGAT